jgi:TolB-like protein
MNKTLILLVMVLARAAFAINSVAVLELLPSVNVEGKISIEESRHLTDELRRQAVMNLPRNEFSVMTRDNIIALMPPDEEEAECLANGCAVDIGRAIGAEYISQGTIGKFGDKLTISVELYETMGAKLLSSIVFESDNISGLLQAIRDEAKPLFQSILYAREKKAMPGTGSSALGSGIGEDGSSGWGVPQWLGIGLAVLGIGAGAYGIMQNAESNRLYRDYDKAPDAAKWKKVVDAESRRRIGYIAGGALLASGITVYFVF